MIGDEAQRGGRFAAVSPAGELEPTPTQPGTPPAASPAVLRIGASSGSPGGGGMAGGQRGGRKPAVSARRRQEMLRRNVVLGVAGVLVVALLGVCVAQRSQDKAAQDELVAKLTAGDCGYDTRSDSGREHVPSPPAYKADPPA